MNAFLRSIALNERQVTTLSDICADMGQVFLASIVLPSFGFGENLNVSSIISGALLMIGAFSFALYFPKNYNGIHEC